MNHLRPELLFELAAITLSLFALGVSIYVNLKIKTTQRILRHEQTNIYLSAVAFEMLEVAREKGYNVGSWQMEARVRLADKGMVDPTEGEEGTK